MASRAGLQFQPYRSAGHAAARQPLHDFQSKLQHAIGRAAEWLLSAQHREGYWWGELEADTTLESDYILYLQILGELNSPKVPKLAKYIRARQLPDGGWSIFPGGPSELNATWRCGWREIQLPHLIWKALARESTSWAGSNRRIPTRASTSRWWARSAGTWFRRFRRRSCFYPRGFP